jgi:spermidine/putrescine transport system permease protein
MSSAVLRKLGREWLWGYILFFAVLLYLPSACIMLFSFNSGIHIKFPLDSFTLDWYRALAANDSLLEAAGNSFRVGFVAASAATVIGVLGGFGLVRYKLKGGKTITGLSIMPLLIPSIILGISLLVLMHVIGVGNSLIAITIGHVIFCTPLSVSIMISRFVDLDRTLEEAALDLGAREIGTFLQITLPLSASAIASAFILCFLTSFDEFVIAFFLAGTESTLPLYIWGQLRFPQKLPEILALGSCVLVGSLILVMLGELLRKGRGTPQ